MARAKIPKDDVPTLDAHVRTLLAETDQQRAKALSELAQLRVARGVVLERDHRLLRGRVGERDPRVRALAERLTRANSEHELLAREAERAGRAAPEPDARAFTLHGYVVDRAGAGVPKVRVAADGHKAPSALSDKYGYFVLRVPLSDPRAVLKLRVVDNKGGTLHEHPESIAAEPGGILPLILGSEPNDSQ